MHESAVLLDFHSDKVHVELQLPIDRLSISFGKTVDEDHFVAEKSELQQYVLAHVHPVTFAGAIMPVTFASMKLEMVEGAPYVVARLTFTAPGPASLDRFTLNYDVISHQIVTHTVLVSIRSDSKAKISLKEPLLIGIIRGNRKQVVVDRMRLL